MLFSFTGLRSDSWDFLLTDQGGAVFAPFSSPNAGLLFFLSGKVRSCPSFSSRFDYFFLTGGLGVLGGFSTDFVSRAFNLTQDESDQLLTYQTGALIVKLVEVKRCTIHGKMLITSRCYSTLKVPSPASTSIRADHWPLLLLKIFLFWRKWD